MAARAVEERLHVTEERMRLLVESVKDYAIFMLDRDGRIESWNDGARTIKGYTRDEVVGKHLSMFYTPEDREAGLPRQLLDIAAREGRVEHEGWRVRKDGSRFWADAIISAVRDDHGRLLGFAKVTRDLTERRAQEEALKRSEEGLFATLYSIGDGVIATDERGRVTHVNPVAERLTGWPQSRALGKPVGEVFNIVNEVTRKVVENPIARVLAEGVIVGLANHTSLISLDGAERPIADSGAPIRDRSGTIHGAVLVFRDVSDERRTEQALRESEEKLRLMVDSVRDYAIFMLDADGNVLSWNQGAELINGFKRGEVIGTHFSRFYLPEDVEVGLPMRELGAAAELGRFEDEGWRLKKDGTRFWASVVLSAIRDEQGNLRGYTKVWRDTTERRRAEQELARRAMQQAAIAELAVYGIRTREVSVLLDKALEVVRRTLGTDSAEVLQVEPTGAHVVQSATGFTGGSAAGATVSQQDEPHLAAALSGADPVLVPPAASARLSGEGVAGGMAVAIPSTSRTQPSGLLATYTTRPATFSQDDLNFFRTVAAVISTAIARSQAEEQVRHARTAAEEERRKTAMAEEAVRDRDVFLSVAAHELRTPLTALQLKLQGLERIIRRELATSPQAAAAEGRFRDALRQTDRLGELVERLLDVSRMAAGKLDMHPEPVDLTSLVQDVIEDFQEKATETKTSIAVTSTGDTTGTWDRRRLEQVVLNLLSNAVKYGQARPVKVAVEGSDGLVRLVVADRGIGIATADRARIFDPFERAAPLEHFAGLGLGLYIARRIVEGHEGTISVSSAPGEGATFVVTLPRRQERP